MFRHHPDGIIYIGDVQTTLYLFLLDEPEYSLPTGMIGREYVPEIRHVLFDSLSQHPGLLPWEAGDTYLSRIEVYRSRVSGPRTLDEIKAGTKMDIDLAADVARRRYATAIAFQELAYLLKAQDADAFMALPPESRPADGAGFPWLQVRLESLRLDNPLVTATDAAQEILGTRSIWQNTKLYQSERLRDVGKRRVGLAADKPGAEAIRDEVVAALRAL